MKVTFSKTAVKTVIALGFALCIGSKTALAQFDGTIGFDGVATFNGSLVAGPTGATEFTGIYGITGPGSLPVVTYGSTSDGYSVIDPGTTAAFNTFSFNPLSTTPFLLWSLTYESTTYSFDVTSETYFQESNGFLNIAGDGIAYVNGTAYTDATWDITDTGNGFALSFGEGTSVLPVPEPSTPVILLGGLAMFCFYFALRSRFLCAMNFGKLRP